MRTLVVVAASLSIGCAATGGRPAPFPRPGPPPALDTVRPGESAKPSGYAVSGTALTLRGTPYRHGGADPRGFDCSGLVRYVFARHGWEMPRTVAEQYRAGTRVPAAELQAGDLVFFSTTAPGPTHVGIVIGGDAFVHAPASSGVVRVERLSANYWASRFIGATRVF